MRRDAADEIEEAWRREKPTTPVESIGVITRVWHAAKLVGDERRRTLARLNIDSATLDLLATLRRSGEPYRMPPGALAQRCLVSKGAITQRVDRAEAAGLVRAIRGRVADGDRRARTTEVELTSQGHELVEDTVGQLFDHEKELLDHLEPAERDQLASLLRKLVGGLIDKVGGPERPTHVGETRR